MSSWETETKKLPEIVSSKAACAILGVSKHTIARWQKPGSGTRASSHGPSRTYMITPQRVETFPLWVKSDVVEFARRIGRQRAASKQQSPTPGLERTTEVLLETHEEIAVAESQDDLLMAIAEARATGGMVRLSEISPIGSATAEIQVHPDAIRRIAAKRASL